MNAAVPGAINAATSTVEARDHKVATHPSGCVGRQSHFLLLAFFFLTICGTALADKRVALVVRNSAYRNVLMLPNPVNDAAAMALVFNNAGFGSADVLCDVGISELRARHRRKRR